MKILGLSNGSTNGNSETLLKAALLAARATDPSITISLIRIFDVSVPRNPSPLTGTQDITSSLIGLPKGKSELNGSTSPSFEVPDDRRAVLDALLDADAIILSSAIYSRQPPGPLKNLTDRILGPFTDPSFAYRAHEARQGRGDPKHADVQFDERLLKPRVAGLIAIGGSPERNTEQFTMALPTMNVLVGSLHAKVVDQYLLRGYAMPGAVLLDGGEAVGRAEELGRNVASQIGNEFEKARYLGPSEDGACPYCHLAQIEMEWTANKVYCITCGLDGKLEADGEGKIRPRWNENPKDCFLTMKGKL